MVFDLHVFQINGQENICGMPWDLDMQTIDKKLRENSGKNQDVNLLLLRLFAVLGDQMIHPVQIHEVVGIGGHMESDV